ncbi:MAG TPA: prepilin-type N-terminal cleavage/methylation domain-containing protein [Longimicrobiales bacterium]|nr:prepilin-type N-terminal cleavage/methylation domain-containing protein [Longimicrobiales bacterium]
MSNEPWLPTSPRRRGFTLIEVIAALVIFSGGVLAVLKLTGALTAQMEYAATTSELVVRSEERLDSLEQEPFASLTLGTRSDTLTVRGRVYVRTATVTTVTGLLKQIQVTLTRADGGQGPSLTVTSYAAALW